MALTPHALILSTVLAVLLPGNGPWPHPAGASRRTVQESDVPAPQGWAALDRGDAARAAAIFRDALERSPYNPALHFGAGYAAYLQGRLDAAISSLRKSLEYDPRFVQAAALLGQVAYERGDLTLAIRSMEKAVSLAPHDRMRAEQLTRWRDEAAVHAALDERVDAKFRILFEGRAQRAVADRVARVLDAAYWRIGAALNSYPTETLTVVLYTERQFQDITRSPSWAAGEFDGRIRVAVGGALRTPDALDRVMVHEFAHAAIASIAPRGVPAWVHEGLATTLEGSDDTWIAQTFAAARWRLTLEQMSAGFDRLDAPKAAMAYAQSAVAGRLLIERLGPNLGIFLQMLGNGHTVAQALSTLDVRPEAFEAAWRTRVAR